MRVAFVDLNFAWPPNGGADTDLYHVLSGLQDCRVEVKLFGLHELGATDRGRFDPDSLPFPAERISFARQDLSPETIVAPFVAGVDTFAPDVVFIQHGYALKPYLCLALAHHKTVARYYAHELACLRDPLRFLNGAPCPHDYLRTPDTCRACALAHHGTAIKRWNLETWLVDLLAAHAFDAAYHDVVLRSLETLDGIVVSNPYMAAHLEGFHRNITVLPGGVDVFRVAPQIPSPASGEKQIILATGRMDDPLKGLGVLLAAGEKLAHARADFEIHATHWDRTLSRDWFYALGWLTHEETLARYADASIVCVPSIWEEPFGLVAVEAMAHARPVVASNVGGLAGIVLPDETGLLVPPNDADALAAALGQLLDQRDHAREMGRAGRARAENCYHWPRVIAQHYMPLLERLTQQESPTRHG